MPAPQRVVRDAKQSATILAKLVPDQFAHCWAALPNETIRLVCLTVISVSTLAPSVTVHWHCEFRA